MRTSPTSLATVSALAVAALTLGCDPDPRAPASTFGERENQLLKGMPKVTLSCRGSYAVVVDGKTKHGNQSFEIAIDPQKRLAHYSKFAAEGTYASGQASLNDEVLPITEITEDWVQVGRMYKFNRRTLKYEFHNGDAVGNCQAIEPPREIPARKV